MTMELSNIVSGIKKIFVNILKLCFDAPTIWLTLSLEKPAFSFLETTKRSDVYRSQTEKRAIREI